MQRVVLVLAGVLLAGVSSGARPIFSIGGTEGDEVSHVYASSSGSDAHRQLLAGSGDLLRQMHRMRHQDHKDEGLNMTRSVLAARTSKMNNRTKARLIKVKKAAAPPKASVKPKTVPAPTPAATAGDSEGAPEGAPVVGGGGEDDLDTDDEWSDEDFDDFNEDDYLEDLLKTCSKDKAIAIFSCSADYAEMCQIAVGNLNAMGIGHLAVTNDENVCDTLGYDDECCTVVDQDATDMTYGMADDMYIARWQYAEIALGFNYDVLLQDCDVLWTKNPVEDFRSDPGVGIIGMREQGTNFPFNAGVNFMRADRAAVLRVVRDVNERIDFFSGVADEAYRLEEIGISEAKCLPEEQRKKLYFDQSIYNDALESSALNDDVYTRSRMNCDDDGRDKHFRCVKGFTETGCLMLEPEYGSGAGPANIKAKNGAVIKCHTDDNIAMDTAVAEEAAPAVAEEAAPAAAEEETPTPTPAAPAAAEEEAAPQGDSAEPSSEPSSEASSSEEIASFADDARRLRRRSHRRHLLSSPIKLREHAARRRAILEDEAAEAAQAEGEDLSEKPTKACVAADDVIASWIWSDDEHAGKNGVWSINKPVTLAMHFVGAGSIKDKIALMKEVLKS
eukprot:CAMPEP_0197575390 /NCGR_PEP_ID=MMETSP1326-20131121/804_1 /TAXON_ID=1155430 /ORGANISM="Genus nov. species nov., Strain RCC2288" /LENGTH=615 /DNA_ID=CAMNT_0043138149 /DNA_START=55 /DNA_END=1902 /DNA_ORIENTATION=+